MFTHPSFCQWEGSLKLKLVGQWAWGFGPRGKGEQRPGVLAIWITEHRSPLQSHPGDPQPPAPPPTARGGLKPAAFGTLPSWGSSQPPPPTQGTPGRAGPRHGRPGAVILGKKAGAPGCDPVRVYLPSANMARLSPSPEGQGEARSGELTCPR